MALPKPDWGVREWTLAGVLAAVVGALLALGSGPETPTRPPLKVLLLDASLSVARGHKDHGRLVLSDLLNEAREAQESGADLAVVRFARDVVLIQPPGDPAVLISRLLHPGSQPFAFDVPRGMDLESSLAGALELGMDLVAEEGRPAGEVVLLGDGWSSGVDPRPVQSRLVFKGHGFRLQKPRGAGRINLQLLSVEGPDRVPDGRSIEVLISLAAQRCETSQGLSGQLFVTVESADGTEEFIHALPKEGWSRVPASHSGAAALERTLAVTLPSVSPGPFRIQVRLDSAADPIPEDNHGFCTGIVGDGPLALLVAQDGGAFNPAWVAALESAGVHCRETDSIDLPGSLARATLLITLDLPLSQLEPHSIEAFLAGGGLWCVLGGQASMAGIDGIPRAKGLASHLPLIPAKDEGGPRDVVLVVDGSGSMVGTPWQRVQEAVLHLSRGLLAGDGLVLHVFTTRLPPALLSVEPGEGEELERAMGVLLRAHLPGGATDVVYVLKQLIEERRTVDRRSVCILISDGHSSQGPDPDPSLRDGLQDVEADLAVIAVEGGGRGANRLGLSRLLRPGEELLVAKDLEGLDEMLREVVERERSIGPFSVTQPVAELGRDVSLNPRSRLALEAFLSRWIDREGPPLQRAWRAQVVPGASTLLRAPSGEPLLASKDVGAGQVVVLAGIPWGHEESAGGHPFLPDLMLALAAEASPDRLSLKRGAGGLRLVGDLAGLSRPLSVHWTIELPLGPGGRRSTARSLGQEPLAACTGDPLGPLDVPWPGTLSADRKELLCARVLDGEGHEVVQGWLLGPLAPDLGPSPWPRLGSRAATGKTPPSGPHPLTWFLLALALGCWTIAGWPRPRA